MSGGFFRGTSAEQDTRFSNKQAKLLKTQRFAAELEYPVDMTRVKMDVIKPWIATRATELLGFEDEVLINFVYELLDGKEVDGKQIQIQLTGFLEKNTGKFMKELWALLLSAQNNASGVPQQFLDAKEEEMKKRKVESDRITQEIQKRKEREGREHEQEKQKRMMDVEAGNSRPANAVSGSSSRYSLTRDSRVQSEKDREVEAVQSPRLKERRTSSPSRSMSKSPSKSGNSKDGRSRSVSVSSESHGRSISPRRQDPSPRRSMSSERQYKSPVRRSITPHHRYSPQRNRSPLRHRSPRARRRSPSIPRHRSPSPIRRRSPYGRRSPSSLRRRSPPSRRRSPFQSRRGSPSALRQRRSPSPGPRRGSPSALRQRRSPSPGPRRGSPSAHRRRSPSPAWRRRSPSPLHRRRSPSPTRNRRSPSPTRHRRSPVHRRVSPSPTRRRISPSPTRRRISPSPAHRKISPSPARRRISPSPPRRRISRSPLHHRISPSPAHHRKSPSHSRRRISPSPSHRRSPVRNRSLSPARRRSISPSRRSSPERSPLNSSRNYGAESQISPQAKKRNRSPYRKSSSSDPARRDSSRETDSRSNGFDTKKYQEECVSERATEKRPLVHDALHREVAELSGSKHGAFDRVPRQLPGASRSPSRDSRDQNDILDKDRGVPSENSSERSGSPSYSRRTRSLGSNRPPGRTEKHIEKRMPHDISRMNGDKEQASLVRDNAYCKTDSSSKKGKDSSENMKKKRFHPNEFDEEEYSNNGLAINHSPGNQGHPSNISFRKESERKSEMDLPKRHARQLSGSADDMEYGPGKPMSRSDAYKDSHHEGDPVKKSKRKMETSSQAHSVHSDTEEEADTRKYKSGEKRKHKKSDKHRRDSDDSSETESDIEDKKEAKRRRKDERRQRKEEKRRKREEKHRKRLQRHSGKHKLKSMDTVTPPPDLEKDYNGAGRLDDEARRRRKGSHLSDAEAAELENELREKALETLRARKGVGH